VFSSFSIQLQVDVLFEEDKGFWVSVNTLRLNSKRPILMTASGKFFLYINPSSKIFPNKDRFQLRRSFFLFCESGQEVKNNNKKLCLVYFYRKRVKLIHVPYRLERYLTD
jgi:hypothetical protein